MYVCMYMMSVCIRKMNINPMVFKYKIYEKARYSEDEFTYS